MAGNVYTRGHFIEVCSCGKIIRQCRCMVEDKEKIVIPNGCRDCQQKALDNLKMGKSHAT